MKNILPNTIGPKKLTLYEMRIRSGVSGSSAARICGATYRSLRNWELGTTIPNIVNIYDLLQVYGFSFYELDLAPFYATYQDRTERQKQADVEIGKSLRNKWSFQQAVGVTEHQHPE